MYYSIFRNSLLVTKVEPLDSSELSQKKQSEDVVRLNFILNDYIDIRGGDYISFEKTGQLYYINKAPRVVESPKNYQYECIFEGGLHQLNKTKVFLTTPKTEGGEYHDYKFPLSGNAETFLYFIIDNLNRNGYPYTAGTFKVTDTVNVEFNNWNALQSITQIAAQLGFDWYLAGSTLNFTAKEEVKPFVFQVGRKVGFTQLIRSRIDTESIETIVYGYGATTNMPPRTSDSSITYDGDLLTENRLSFDGVNGESKLENNTGVYGNVESIQEFNDIYPTRTGVVTSVSSSQDNIFYDSTVDFDVNDHLLAGIKPKINFITGKLIGLDFNITFVDSTNEFTLDYYTDESGAYPNDIIFPEVGDQYKLFDISMPLSYIEEASTRLQEATQSYLDNQSKRLELFQGDIDQEFIQLYEIVLNLGDIIRVVSAPFAIDNSYEIKELTQGITDPNKYSVKFGDVIPKSLLTLLTLNNFSTQQSIYNVQRTSVTNNEVTNITGSDTEWQKL